jgi:polysaccharide export outer membrane protein
MLKPSVYAALIALPLVACSSDPINLPAGASARQVFPIAGDKQVTSEYRIGPLDKLTITVFQEEDLSVKDIPVDAAGNISMPLIGTVNVAGNTASQLSTNLARRLDDRYLVNAQVSVIVTNAASQKVIVDGAVTEAGVYEIRGSTSLIEVLALAKGTTRTAETESVAIFRHINGQRMGALFNVSAIRRGEAEDPLILGGDTVVVAVSGRRAMWQDILQAAPAFAVFVPLATTL